MVRRTALHTAHGIEAMVCEDIARRQAHGVAKYGTTVADNPLHLRAWCQHLYEELLDAAVYVRRAIFELDKPDAYPVKAPPTTAPAPVSVASGMPVKGRGDPLRFNLGGQLLTIGELAAKAGCSWTCMQQRLRHNSPERAVALGGPGPTGRRRSSPAATATAAPQPAGQPKAARPEGKGQRTAKPAGPRLTKPSNKPAMPLKPQPAGFTSAEAVVPPNVKRTVATPPQDRFAVSQPQQSTFGRIGQYESTGSALERALAPAGGTCAKESTA